MSVFYVGAAFDKIADYESYIDVRAPKNYKDPAKIAQYIQDRKYDLSTAAAFMPLTGKLTRIHAICISDKDRVACDFGPNAGTGLISAITSQGGTSVESIEATDYLIGYQIQAVMRLALLEYVENNSGAKARADLGRLRWIQTMDPVEALCGNSYDINDFGTVQKLARRLKVPEPIVDTVNELALFAEALTDKFGFYPLQRLNSWRSK